jgi:hypothetical protein
VGIAAWREWPVPEGCTASDQLVDRHTATVHGVVRAITIRPRQSVPVFEVDLFDGSGSVKVRWLGRRSIRGVGPGVWLRATGRVRIPVEGERIVWNPSYELTGDPRE